MQPVESAADLPKVAPVVKLNRHGRRAIQALLRRRDKIEARMRNLLSQYTFEVTSAVQESGPAPRDEREGRAG